MPLWSLNKQCEKLRPTTTIPSNFVNNLHNETLTVGSAAQGGLIMGHSPPPRPLTITDQKKKSFKAETIKRL